jgi:hypothetical protein
MHFLMKRNALKNLLEFPLEVRVATCVKKILVRNPLIISSIWEMIYFPHNTSTTVFILLYIYHCLLSCAKLKKLSIGMSQFLTLSSLCFEEH